MSPNKASTDPTAGDEGIDAVGTCPPGRGEFRIMHLAECNGILEDAVACMFKSVIEDAVEIPKTASIVKEKKATPVAMLKMIEAILTELDCRWGRLSELQDRVLDGVRDLLHALDKWEPPPAGPGRHYTEFLVKLKDTFASSVYTSSQAPHILLHGAPAGDITKIIPATKTVLQDVGLRSTDCICRTIDCSTQGGCTSARAVIQELATLSHCPAAAAAPNALTEGILVLESVDEADEETQNAILQMLAPSDSVVHDQDMGVCVIAGATTPERLVRGLRAAFHRRVWVSPLTERRADIPPLVMAIVEELPPEARIVGKRFIKDDWLNLIVNDYPDGARDLRRAVFRLAEERADERQPRSVEERVPAAKPKRPPVSTEQANPSAGIVLPLDQRRGYNRPHKILAALSRFAGDVDQAATHLGIEPDSVLVAIRNAKRKVDRGVADEYEKELAELHKPRHPRR